MFGELDACVGFHFQQFEKRALLGVIRLGGVARCRADAPVAFPDQVFGSKLLVTLVTPCLAHLLMQVLGKRLGQSVAEGLRQNRVVVVVLGFILMGDCFDFRPCGDGKRPQIIPPSRADGCDEIRQRLIRLAVGFRILLA